MVAVKQPQWPLKFAMLRQGIIYLVLSILIVLFAEYAHLLVVYIVTAYTFVLLKITPIFSSTTYGVMIRNVCSLVIIPVMIAGIPALIYQVIKSRKMPYFIEITWVLWLIIVLAKVLIR